MTEPHWKSVPSIACHDAGVINRRLCDAGVGWARALECLPGRPGGRDPGPVGRALYVDLEFLQLASGFKMAGFKP